MPSANRENHGFSLNAGAIVKGSLSALALAFSLSVAAGLAYHFTSLPEHTMPWVAVVVLGAGSCGGAVIAGRSAGARGLYHGLAVGAVFFLAVWAAAGVFLPGQAALSLLEKVVVALAAGGLGGAVGVGLS
ncbi:MAG: TIGR04086 family membrane protein [Firmicutes bacterium]|nr:TIGR04086 family membrane protein [Bacillota bacterium]